MDRQVKYICFFLFWLGFQSVFAQSYNFRQLSNSEGLSQSQVLCITQDKRGFLWIGTAGGGLNRFDGQQFRNYTTYDGLPDDNIWSVFCDSKNRLWLGTSTGLAMLENGKFRTFPSYNGLDDDKIFHITEDAQGHIWVATANNGVSIYDGKKFRSYGINDGLNISECNRILCMPDGTTWVGSYGYGLVSYKNGRFTRVGTKENFGADYVFDMEARKDGSFLILTEMGLYEYKNGTFALINPVDFDYSRSSDLLINQRNEIWLSTYGLGVYVISENKTTLFNQQNGLKVDDIICLYQDDAGNTWMGTNGSGLYQYHGNAFITYNQSCGLSNNIVRGLALDQEQNVLVGTSVGIDKIKADGSTEVFFNKPGYFNCSSIFRDHTNRIWASFDNAAGYFDGRKNFVPISGLPSNVIVNDFYEDHNDLMWLATNDGLFVLRNGKLFRRLRDSVPETNVFSLRKSTYHPRSFWICSSAGLVLYDGTYIRSVRIKKPNENIDIVDVWEDPIGKLWVISNRGLCIVKTNGEKIWLNRQNGLSSNNLFSIEYFDGALWIGSDKGIDRLQLDHRFRLQKIEFFGKNKGFLGEEINSLGCLQNNGKMYFATINGLFIYNPGNYVLRNHPPDLYISEIALNYRKINWEKEWPNVPLTGGLPQGIVFDPNQNYLTFYFNAIDFNSPENVRIQFMLQGLDTSWINATSERQATYSNLSSGNYIFKVRATNDNFTWGTPATFRFTINAPFWKKTWFIVLLVPALLVFGYLMSQWRTRRLRRVQARLKLKVDERTRELRYKNDELEKLSIVASKTNDGVLICDRNGRIVFVNDGFKRMTSFTAEAFDKSEYNKQFLQELSSQNNIEDLIKQIKETGKSISYESTHKLPDGNIRWTQASLTPIFNEDALDKIIVIYTDITDRVITEHALIQTNKDITDSIHYAKKIQEAILPSHQILLNNFPQSFIFYRPRDIVSGDFYWFTRIRNVFVLACADCTGHGVPGAMMTMIGNEFLHQIVNNAMVTGPDVALNLLDKQISRAMNTDGLKKEARDGMDIGLCVIDINSLGTKFAGAGIPMYIVRGNEILEYDALKVSIGSPKTDGQTYTAHEFALQKGDMLYLTTDGFVDQLGGEKGRKYMRKRFKEFLAGIAALDPESQYAAIAREYEEHRVGFPQTDDVLVMGVRI